MRRTKRYLVVANQTVGGQELERILEDRLAGGGSFWVVVPRTEQRHESLEWRSEVWGEGAWLDAPDRAGDGVRDHADRVDAEQRLAWLTERIRTAGGQVGGQIGDPDPVTAVADVLDRQLFDEVIVSTLPAGVSRWLKMDLPSRVSRMTDAPVTVVEADA